jgi:hypothetical protein
MGIRITDEELLEEINRIYKINGKATVKLLREEGKYSEPTYIDRFGSWNNALKEAGVDINKEINIDKKDLISELQSLNREYGKVTTNLMDNKGKYSSVVYIERFGSWNESLKKANIEINIEMDVDRDRLIYELKRLNIIYENVHYDLIDKEGIYSTTAYENEFGTINNALTKAEIEKYKHPSGEQHPNWNGSCRNKWYGINWREQREKTIKRDNYSCQKCGKEDNFSYNSETPDVHHINPVRNYNIKQDYEEMNDLNNLISLCRSCHNKVEGKWKDLSVEEFKEKL